VLPGALARREWRPITFLPPPADCASRSSCACLTRVAEKQEASH